MSGLRTIMTSREVRALIDEEIRTSFSGDTACAGSHGVDLNKCLLAQPEVRSYLDPVDGKPVQKWLVLEEDPQSHSGYQVVFDESLGRFGLASSDSVPAVFIGHYGSFIDTLEAM
jgi:hypothetical protein